jgi:hypothetical protein
MCVRFLRSALTTQFGNMRECEILKYADFVEKSKKFNQRAAMIVFRGLISKRQTDIEKVRTRHGSRFTRATNLRSLFIPHSAALIQISGFVIG